MDVGRRVFFLPSLSFPLSLLILSLTPPFRPFTGESQYNRSIEFAEDADLHRARARSVASLILFPPPFLIPPSLLRPSFDGDTLRITIPRLSLSLFAIDALALPVMPLPTHAHAHHTHTRSPSLVRRRHGSVGTGTATAQEQESSWDRFCDGEKCETRVGS